MHSIPTYVREVKHILPLIIWKIICLCLPLPISLCHVTTWKRGNSIIKMQQKTVATFGRYARSNGRKVVRELATAARRDDGDANEWT